MDITDVMRFLAVLLAQVSVVAAAGWVVYIMLRSGTDRRVGLPLRLVLRTFLHPPCVIRIVFPASGASVHRQALGSPWPVSEGVRTL